MWSRSDVSVPVPLGPDFEALLEAAAAAGVGAEFQGFYDPLHLGGDFSAALGRVEVAFRGYPGAVSLHAPYLDLNPVSRDPAVAAITDRRYAQAFEAADRIGASVVVVHSQFAAYLREETYEAGWAEASAAWWRERREAWAPAGRRIAFENIFETGPAPLAGLVDRLGGDPFGVCLDVGHAHLFSGDAASWVPRLGSRIAYVHLHDNDGVWDRHLPPGEGGADARAVLEALLALPDRPRLCLELFAREQVVKAVPWLEAEGFLAPP